MNFKNLFNKKSKEFNNPYWEFDEQNHFKPKVNQGDFFRLSGSDFCWFILKPMSKFVGSHEHEIERTKKLSYAQKALYFWWYLDAQVTNGGFVQFYYNGYGDYIPIIIKSLEYIGDTEMAKLVKGADKIYQKRKRIFEKKKAQNESLFDGDLYEQLDDLVDFDDDYFDLNEDTMLLIEKYCRQNPDEFCLTENGQSFKDFSGLCETFYENNRPKEIFKIENNLINGAFQSFYPNGELKEQIDYKYGKKTGEESFYFENGKLKKSVKPLKDNVLEYHSFYENGNPKKLEHRTKDKDERYGIYKEWYKNGQLTESGTYVSDYKRDGEWLEFYEDGTKKIEADFVDGIRQIHHFWNDKGEHLLKDGTGIYFNEYSMFNDSDVTIYKYEYKDYKRHGEQQTIEKNIVITSKMYVDGKQHGITRSFYNNGNLKEEILFKNDKEISKKEFPMFQNPKVITTIKCEMEDEWLINRDLPIADTYPIPKNHIELADNFKVDIDFFNGYSQDDELSYSYFVGINEIGEVTTIDFSIADNAHIREAVEANIQKICFEPATKDGEATASYIYIKHKFILGE